MATPYDFASGLPPEIAAQASALARRRALAEALMGRALAPAQAPQSGGRMASVMSPLQPIAQVLTAGLASKGLQETDTAGQVLGMSYKEMQNKAIAKYLMDRKKDPMSAAITAASSDFEPVRKLGIADFEAISKGTITPKDLLGAEGASVPSRVKAATGGGVTALEAEPKYQAVADQLVEVPRETGGKPRTAGYYGPEYDKNPDGTTKIVQQAGADGKPEPYIRESRSGKLVKLDQAPKVTVTATADARGPTAGAEKIFELAATTVSDLGKNARSATQMSESMNRLEALDRQGIYSNVTTGPTTWLTNLAQAAGLELSDAQVAKLGNTETFNSVSNEALQRLISQLGGNRNVTREEVEYLIKTIVPQARQSPQARKQIYDFVRNVAGRETARFHKANKALTEAITKRDPSLWQSQFADVFAPMPQEPLVVPSLGVELEQGLPPPVPLSPGQTVDPRQVGPTRPYGGR